MAEFATLDRFNFVARAVVSLIVLCAGLYVLLFGNYPDAIVKWAIGAIAIVIGYWLR
jgi:membrane-bound ClpP family serine protease